MSRPERVPRLLDDLADTLEAAAELVARGGESFDTDLAVSLAFEALCNRVGDLSKQLVKEDPEAFPEIAWTRAARNRDAIVHHYERILPDRLWETVSSDFPELHRLVLSKRTI